MVCPQCLVDNPDTSRFCGQCGEALAGRCPRCQEPLAPREPLCRHCGAPVDSPLSAPLGENRIATVLFADMCRFVETTRNLEAEDTMALVDPLFRAMEAAIHRYEGRLCTFLGDGVLAVFGVPWSHESDPERALWAAEEMRGAAAKLGFRIRLGINTGEVYAGRVGSGGWRRSTVMGPAVNLASRLQGASEPGEILVGESTYRHTQRAFRFEPRTVTLKGYEAPVRAYRVEEALPRPEKARGLPGLRSELVGRDEEIEALRLQLREALAGRGRLACVVGDAGLGKSRLLAELRSLEPAALWLEGRCLELTRGTGYGPFVDLLRDLLHLESNEEGSADKVAALVAQVESMGFLAGQRVPEVQTLVANLLGVPLPPEWANRLQGLEASLVRRRTLEALRDLLLALARSRPLVLVLEDLHWADELSLELLRLLNQSAHECPVLLLCTFRPDPSHACWSVAHEARAIRPERYLEVRLRELTAEQSRGMVGSLLRQSELPVLLEGTVLERSQGNPLYVEELVRTLIDAGSLYQEEGVWVARDARETLLLPDSVQSIIQTRVDRLSPARKQVLEYAAVFGRLLRRDLLEAVLAGQDDLTASLEELSLRGFLVQGRHGPGEEYSFRHVLAQETVYQALLKGRKSLLHRRAAEAVETLYGDSLEPFYEDLAHHYGNTADAEKTVHYLLRSGEKARRSYLNDAAISYLTRSLARMDEAEDPTGQIPSPWYSQRLEALRSLGLLYQGMGKVAEAETCLRQAIETSESLELPVAERVRLYYWLSDVLWWQCRYEETIALGQTGLALLGDDSHSTEAALMNTAQAISYMNLGDRLRFWELTQCNARFISELPYTEELRPSYGHIFAACAYDDKDPEAARGWLDRLEVLAERHQDLRALGMIWGHRGSLARSCGDLSGAVRHFEEALAIYTRIGDAKHRGDFLDHLGWTHLILGDPQKASEYEALAVSILQEVGNRRDMAWTMMTAATMAFCRGDLQEAVGQATQALEGYHSISHPYEAMAALTLAWVLLACGERSQAMFLLASAVAMVDIQQIQSYPREFAIAIAGLERACERRDEFLAFCKGLQERRLASGAREELGFQSCCLTPGGSPRRGAVEEQWSNGSWSASWQASTPPEPWRWEDPYGDCTCSPVAEERVDNPPTVLMRAPNGRDLWRINLSAPRLLRPVRGSFALEITCTPSEAGAPSIGGLLLWWDRGNYLRLDRGTRGPAEVSLSGCVRNEDVLWGRGMLPDSEAVTLRLERLGNRAWALCRAGDGEWHTLGEAPVPDQEELGAGLFASGTIDRRVYPGAYPEGSAIHFTGLKLERLQQEGQGDRRD